MSVNELLVYELTTPLSFDPEKAYVLYELKSPLLELIKLAAKDNNIFYYFSSIFQAFS